VSDLEPCEPLEQTLAAIRELPGGCYLRVLHRREPHMLYSLLEKAGFSWQTRRCDDPGYQIFIWRRDDDVAADAARLRAEEVMH